MACCSRMACAERAIFARSRPRRDELGVERRSFLELAPRFFLLTLLLQSQSQLQMGRGVVRRGSEARPELRNRAVQVTCRAQALAGVGGKHSRLQVGRAPGQLGTGAGFRGCALSVAELPQDRR